MPDHLQPDPKRAIAFPSAYLLQVPVNNRFLTEIDPQCETVEVGDDAQGRAFLSEKHVAYGLGKDAIPVGNGCNNPNYQVPNANPAYDTCASYTCGCDSKWELVGTEAGGPMQGATKIRYRQVFSGGDGGGCWSIFGGSLSVNSVARYHNQVEVFPPDLSLEYISSGTYGMTTWYNTRCGQNNWWSGGVDHTSFYVNAQGRLRADERVRHAADSRGDGGGVPRDQCASADSDDSDAVGR